MFPWYMFVGMLGQLDDEEEKHRSTGSCSDFYYEKKRKRERWSLGECITYTLNQISLHIRMPFTKLRMWREYCTYLKNEYSFLKSKAINFRDRKYANAKAFLKNFHEFRLCKFDEEFVKNEKEIAKLKRSFLKINKTLKLQMIAVLKEKNDGILKSKRNLSIANYIETNNIFDAEVQLRPLISYVEEKNLVEVATAIRRCPKDYMKFGKYNSEMIKLIAEVEDVSLHKTFKSLKKDKSIEKNL